MTGRTLVAGIGNIFLGDDGFGVEVASRLASAELPDGVQVVDYGIRGMHLAYDLANGFDAAILVDATPRGGAPGTIYVIEPDLGPAPEAPASTDPASTDPASTGPASAGPTSAETMSPLFDAHGMQPDVVFGILDMLGGARPARILVVGCEPASVDYGMSLSEPVAAAVDEAVRVVLDLVTSTPGVSIPAGSPQQAAVSGTAHAGGQSDLSSELFSEGVGVCASVFPVR